MKSGKIKPVLLSLFFLGLLGFGAVRIWQAYELSNAAKAKNKAGGGKNSRIVTVGTGFSQTVSLREDIMITGALKPKEQVDVMPKTTGRLERITVEVGDHVKKGDLIAELDDDELQQQIKRAQASIAVVRATIAQRRAELANAEADLKRAETLEEGGLIARQDYEAKRTTMQVVRAQVALAEAQEDQASADLNELKIQLSQRMIYAPMDSFIAERLVDTGALVNPAMTIVRLVNLSTMVTKAYVPERAVSKLRIGAPASVHVDAFGEQTFIAHISRVSPVLDAATRSGMVEVEIPNPTAGLKAEMFARVSLDLGTTRPAVMIPREALVYRGQQAGVYTFQGTRPIFRPIEAGISQGNMVEVRDNLPTGTRIITRGASMITDGDQIQVVDQDETALPKSSAIRTSQS